MIDYAEALTVIDVNTGSFTGKGKSARLEDTITKTNLEAADEVVRQLRLRDIGGIIVIDFIDMARSRNREAVLKVLRKALDEDRTKTFVVEISPLGLVEMTRQNVTDGVREIMTKPCPVCSGEGVVKSEETIAIEFARHLRHMVIEAGEAGPEAYLLRINPKVTAWFIADGARELHAVEEETGRYFHFEGSDGLPLDHFAVTMEGTRAEIEEHAVPFRAGEEVHVNLVEPHMYNDDDAVAKVDGYLIDVVNGVLFVGEKKLVRIEEAGRTIARAVLVGADAEVAEEAAQRARRRAREGGGHRPPLRGRQEERGPPPRARGGRDRDAGRRLPAEAGHRPGAPKKTPTSRASAAAAAAAAAAVGEAAATRRASPSERAGAAAPPDADRATRSRPRAPRADGRRTARAGAAAARGPGRRIAADAATLSPPRCELRPPRATRRRAAGAAAAAGARRRRGRRRRASPETPRRRRVAARAAGVAAPAAPPPTRGPLVAVAALRRGTRRRSRGPPQPCRGRREEAPAAAAEARPRSPRRRSSGGRRRAAAGRRDEPEEAPKPRARAQAAAAAAVEAEAVEAAEERRSPRAARASAPPSRRPSRPSRRATPWPRSPRRRRSPRAARASARAEVADGRGAVKPAPKRRRKPARRADRRARPSRPATKSPRRARTRTATTTRYPLALGAAAAGVDGAVRARRPRPTPKSPTELLRHVLRSHQNRR